MALSRAVHEYGSLGLHYPEDERPTSLLTRQNYLIRHSVTTQKT